MKHFLLPTTPVMLLILTLICSPGAAGPADDFFALSKDYETAFALDLTEAIPKAMVLKAKEMELTNRLLENQAERDKLVQSLNGVEPGLLERLSTRVAFEVEHEGRAELAPFLETLQESRKPVAPVVATKKKIARIGAREVDLLHGEWKAAPDGRRFWVSAEFADVVLTAAEYRRHAASAADKQEP